MISANLMAPQAAQIPYSSGRRRWLQDPGLWFSAVVAAITLFVRFRFGKALLGFYDDDFFYYLQVAKNLATRGVSTFDGVHLTNGYHPLWLVLLAGIYKVFPGDGFFYALEVLTFVLTLAVYVLVDSCILRYTSDTRFATVVSAAVTLLSLTLARGGMETTVALPLWCLVLNYRLCPTFRFAPAQMLVLGFLVSLAILSRLDSAILFMLMFAADAFANRFSFLQWTSSGIACAAGAVPLWGYLLMNQKVFGMMLPVSAKAKELRFHHYPSLIPIKYVLIPTSLSIALLFLPALAVGIFAVVRLVHNRQVFAKQSVWPVAVALLVFPIIHLVAVSLISDWPLFLWYLYPFVLSIFGSAIAIVATSKYPARPAPLAVVRYSALGLFVMGSIYAMLFAWFRKPTDLYFSSTQIARFAETHPGTYAMGDRSGTVAFLISRPLIQLEGLTMDKQFLQRLRTGDDLTKVLRDYGVSYYIATEPELRGGCYVAVEPRQAGPDSVKMHGTLCARPVARFSRSGVEEDIFDVRGI